MSFHRSQSVVINLSAIQTQFLNMKWISSVITTEGDKAKFSLVKL